MSSRVEQLFVPSSPVEHEVPSDSVTLGEDPISWQAEVHQNLVGTVNLPPEAIPTIELHMEDEDAGHASGAVILQLHGQNIIVPVIIREGQLYPLDTFYFEHDEENVRPLTTENLNEAIARGTMDYRKAKASAGGAGYVDGVLRGDAQTLENLQGPNGYTVGHSKMASDEGLISDLVSNDAIDDEQIRPLMLKMAKDRDATQRLREMPAEVNLRGELAHVGIPKVALGLMRLVERSSNGRHGKGCCCGDCSIARAPDAPEAHAFSPDRLAVSDVFQVRMIGPGRFRLHATCDRVFLPIVRDLSSSEVRTLFEGLFSRFASREKHDVGEHVNRLVAQLQRDGRVTVRSKSSAKKPGQLFARRPVVEDASQFGAYVVKQEGGVADKGVVFPNVYDLDGGRLPLTVFISGKSGNYACAESFVGVPDPNVVLTLSDLAKIDAGSGREVLIAWESSGEICALPPLTIERMERGAGSTSAICTAGINRPVRLILDPMLQHPVAEVGDGAVDGEGRTVYRIPSRHAAVRVTKRIELVSSASTFEKLGEDLGEGELLDLRRQGDGRYHVKLAGAEWRDLSEADADLLLATSGVGSEGRGEIFSKLASSDSGRFEARGIAEACISSQEELDKLAEAHRQEGITSEDRRAASAIQGIMEDVDVVKLAASQPDGAMADRMVALSFLTEDNITTFRRYVPDLQKAVSRLAKLLVFSRLSGQMDEVSIKRAMILLDRVVQELQGLTQYHLDDVFAE